LPRPLWFIPATPVLTKFGAWVIKKRSVTALFMDRDVQLDESLKFNRFYKRLQRWWSQDDFVLHLQPQMGVGAFASAFGCKIEFPWNQMPWPRPVIKAGEPAEKVYELTPPDVRSGLLGDILDFGEYFNKKAGHEYPIAMTDLQGPLDTAYLVWNSCDFMVAMYRHPKEVHHLMRMCTDIIIKHVKEFRTRVKEFLPAHCPNVYLADGAGITVSEDALAVISRKLYEEFSLPYINELSEEFGGIVIHSCGNFEHQLPVLQKVHKLRGVNFGVTETKFEAVWEALAGKTCIIPHCTEQSIVADFPGARDWVEHVLRYKTHNRGLALAVYPVVGDIHAMALDVALDRPTALDKWGLLNFGRDMRALIKKYQ